MYRRFILQSSCFEGFNSFSNIFIFALKLVYHQGGRRFVASEASGPNKVIFVFIISNIEKKTFQKSQCSSSKNQTDDAIW